MRDLRIQGRQYEGWLMKMCIKNAAEKWKEKGSYITRKRNGKLKIKKEWKGIYCKNK